MNIKTNILFFVKNTVLKVKTTNQDYHYNEWHHKKPKQLYIQKKDYNFPVQKNKNKTKQTLCKLYKVDNFIPRKEFMQK